MAKAKPKKLSESEALVEEAFTKQFDGIHITPFQLKEEITQLLDFLKTKPLKTIMEIGTANGGTLYMWTKIADPEALIIGVDLPNGKYGGGYDATRKTIYENFKQPKQSMVLFQLDSHDLSTFHAVEHALDGRKLDFLFIDGDHSYGGVKKDFEMYSRLVADKGIIVLHDVTEHHWNLNCHVKEFWDELKIKYEHKLEMIEFQGIPMLTPYIIYGGIGALIWRYRPLVHIIMPCHDISTPAKFELFERSTFQLSFEPYPKTLWCDPTVTPEIKAIAKKNGFIIRDTTLDTEWGKVRQAYRETDAEYIAICHADDIWLRDKLKHQLPIAQNAAMVLTPYVVYNDYKEKKNAFMFTQQMEIRSPVIVDKYGIVDCMPSSWLINKSLVSEIPDPFQETFGKDCAIVSLMTQIGPVIVTKDPGVIYHEHGDNQWFISNHERHSFACDLIAQAVAKCKEIRLYHESDPLPVPTNQVQKGSIILRQSTIMLIGWFDADKYGPSFATMFEAEGHKVIRVSADDDAPQTTDFQIFKEPHSEFRTGDLPYPIQPLIKQYKETDIIFLCQVTQCQFDLTDVTRPVFYFYSEPGFPWWPIDPNNCIVAVFHTFPTAWNQLRVHFPSPTIQLERTKSNFFVPWACDPTQFPDQNLMRVVDLGFQGSLEWQCDPYPVSPEMAHFYDERKYIFNNLKTLTNNQRAWGSNAHASLVQFYNTVKIAINVPGWELTNERQYWALSMGCILLQQNYPQLAELGFGDKYNCLTFSTIQEAEEKIKWVLANPDKAEEIRKYGKILIAENSWKHRASKILGLMAKVMRYEDDRFLFTRWEAEEEPKLEHLEYKEYKKRFEGNV